mgnify:CR=1 FL=1
MLPYFLLQVEKPIGVVCRNELIFEVAKGELYQLTELVRKEMGGAYPLKAPLDVNVGVGESWDEAAH